MPYSQGLHCHTLWLCAFTFGSPVSLSFWVWILCFLVLYLLYFGPVNVSVDILGTIDDACLLLHKKKDCSSFFVQSCGCTNNCNVFFGPVGCIFIWYVIWSSLSPYLPSVCMRSILGSILDAMGTPESHWSLVHWFVHQTQKNGYVHNFSTGYNLQFLSSSKRCLKFLLCVLHFLPMF
jgi:hypothetical protein